MELTDIKDVYPVFKFFKNIYTRINKGTFITLKSDTKTVSIEFSGCPNGEFFILTGEILSRSKFTDWLLSSECEVKFLLEDIQAVAKCLKKNAQKISYNDSTFTFSFESGALTLSKSKLTENEKYSKILKKLTKKLDLSDKFFTDEICEIYLKDGKLSFTEGEKILEIPTKRIISIQKGGTNSILYSLVEDGKRYVSVISKTEDLILKQTFATI